MKIDRIGGGFSHAPGSTWYKVPKYVEWVSDGSGEISMYIDEAILTINSKISKPAYGWIHESRAICSVNEKIREDYLEVIDSYESIFTHEKSLLELHPKFKFCPAMGTWITDLRYYDKSKLVSMISSSKKMCDGHNYRLDWANKLKDKLDLFGFGFNPIKSKEEGLCDYMFSVAIENDSYETYFTEKLLDCFATCTIPIYHGAPNIGDYFNTNGIIQLTENFDINSLTKELYESKIDAIIDNLERTKSLEITEDWLYKTYLER